MAAFLLSTVLPAALLRATQVGATTFPATVEVDLIFPRNDTYAPSALFPIVFAFQNAALVPSLDPGFDLSLWDSDFHSGIDPFLGLKDTNFSNNDPLYVYTYVANLNTTGGNASASHLLTWAFSAGNCSNKHGPLELGGGFRNNSVVFTIQSGAQQPDLVAATASSASCANISHFAFNLTGTLDVTLPGRWDGRNTCAVFSEVQPRVAGNPCAVQFSSATASSISAAIMATACAYPADPGISCKPTNVAPKRWKTGNTGYAAVLLLGAFAAVQCL